ncbi:MAG: ATP-dependent DNA helicase [Bacteroidota bacterium]
MSRLTKHQKNALEEILERLDQGVRYTSVRGYAGTGKTFLLDHLVKKLQLRGMRVAACAPTHKAARVLNDRLAGRDVRAQTIHSFLGLRLKPDGQGAYRLEPEPGHELPDDGVVIVDEASMVGLDEWPHIERAWNLQFIFVGDPAQLPPVNEGASPVFELDGPVLTDVVRQARGNPIIELATRLRSGEDPAFEPAFDGRHGIGVTRSPGAFLTSAMRAFSDARFHDDPTFARILAYRNATVRRYNASIRKHLFPDANERFTEDEWLVARETWYHEDQPVLINSEEVRVVSAGVAEAADAADGPWKIWELGVEGADGGLFREVHVLHESEHARFRRALDRRKREAIRGEGDWLDYYGLRERFADVDYTYASTIHKAQGSTFNTAYVDLKDAAACRGAEHRALLYVAVTRPADRLALLL